MYEIQYILLFISGLLVALGAFLGHARGFSAIAGTVVWFILGNASTAVEYFDPSGASHVATSVSLTWLCYGVAAMHVVVLLIAIHDQLTDDDDVGSADELGEAVDPSQVDSGDISRRLRQIQTQLNDD